MRRALLLTLLLMGCGTVGFDRVPGPPRPDSPPQEAPRRVLVIVVDGLRADVLTAYAQSLRDDGYEPAWDSGLALLAREGFALGVSARVEAPIPAFGLVGDATLATGAFPADAGLPGAVFYEAYADGRLWRFDFRQAPTASQQFFAPELETPTAEPPLLGKALTARTLYERLEPAQASTVIFHPFGRGAEWLIPARAGVATAALLPHPQGSAAVPLLDRGAREAALDVLLSKRRDPAVLTLAFRGVSAVSCFQADGRCEGTSGKLQARQAQALRIIDGHLWQLLRRVRGARPERLKGLSVVLVGNGGMSDRSVGGEVDTQQVVSAQDLAVRLAAHAPDEACATWWRKAEADQELGIAADGGFAQLYTQRALAGQRTPAMARLRCVGETLKAALKREPWLGAVAYLPPESVGALAPRGRLAVVELEPSFARALPAHRRAQLETKLKRTFDDAEPHRFGDALLFTRDRWVFAEPGREPWASRGGLDDGTLSVPLLVAHPTLSDEAAANLRATPVELADVASTVLLLAGAPEATLAGMPRPSILSFKGDALVVTRAARQVAAPVIQPEPGLILEETGDQLTVGLEESKSLWPPDEVEIKLGDRHIMWKSDPGTFAEGEPCQATEADGRRRIQCTFPLDRGRPQATLAAVRRRPSTTDGRATDDFFKPVLLGKADVTLGAEPSLVCASESRLEVWLDAQDELGLDRLEVGLMDRFYGAAQSGDTWTSVPLCQLSPSPECATDLKGGCALSPIKRTLKSEVAVPFPANRVRHRQRSASLLGATPLSPDPLAAWTAAHPERQPPKDALLMVRVCGNSGRCVTRPLVSDREYADALTRGCP